MRIYCENCKGACIDYLKLNNVYLCDICVREFITKFTYKFPNIPVSLSNIPPSCIEFLKSELRDKKINKVLGDEL